MNIQIVDGTLIVGALLAIAPSNRYLAESTDTNVSAPQSAVPNTHRASPKHRVAIIRFYVDLGGDLSGREGVNEDSRGYS
jgi:hypothetical protein